MPIFVAIIVSTFLISLISFAGVLFLFLKEKVLNRILLLLVSFSAGALLGDAFLHLLPESIGRGGVGEEKLFKIFVYFIMGFCLFFILEQFIKWHHHHSTQHAKVLPFSYLILISDGVHNFIDGLIIAGSFLVNFEIGLATSLAVIFHEIPQEIGDFALLIYGGLKKGRALTLNFLSAILAILGGVFGFFLLKGSAGESFILPFTAGCFVYIAASDLIPQVKEEEGFKKAIIHFLSFLTGILILALMRIMFE